MPNVCCFCKKAQGSLDHAVSFHRFPKDPIQRNIWLQNCKLEDTARIEHKTLCSDHFNSSCYISNTNRLLKNAVPTIFPGGAEHLMPEVVESLDQPAENLISSPLTIFQPVRLFSESPSINTPSYSASCSTPISDGYSYSSDSSISTQTERCLTKNTPRKMKLKGKLADTESKLKKTVRERDNLKVINYNLQQRLNATPTLSDFEEMCDKFFNIKSMSDFVKNQARLSSSKGRRYTEKDKQFALMIHFYGPKVYRFLKKTWCLPSVRTLQRITEKWEIGVGISDFVLNVLSLKGQTMNVKGKECVLCADEMSLKSFLHYN